LTLEVDCGRGSRGKQLRAELKSFALAHLGLHPYPPPPHFALLLTIISVGVPFLVKSSNIHSTILDEI
jgi:hypothetical protein